MIGWLEVILISWLSSATSIWDFAQPVLISPPSSAFNHFIDVLWPALCPPIPILRSPALQFSSPNFSSCLLNHQPLSHLFAQLPLALPYPYSWFTLSFLFSYMPKLFFLSLHVFHQSHSSVDLILSSQINPLRKITAIDWQMTQKIQEEQFLSFSSGPGMTEAAPNWK